MAGSMVDVLLLVLPGHLNPTTNICHILTGVLHTYLYMSYSEFLWF
jgi:hypothetical protein